MLQAGSYCTLTVNRISDHGLYLADEDGGEVLLPNRYVSLADKPGDRKEVFVYHDSEDRLIATTERPFAVVGEAAYLRVVDKTVHGAFLDWGVTAKDLFIPNSNQPYRMDPGSSYVVYLYRDNVTGRVVATAKLNAFVSNESIAVKPGEEVDILVARRLPVGFRVIVNARNWGMIYDNQIFTPVAVGDRLKAYVVRISEDGRIDLSLQKRGFDQVRSAADRLLGMLDEAGGRLGLHDKSSPEEIAARTGLSKKVFRRTVGYLMKRGELRCEEDCIVRIRPNNKTAK